MLFFIIRYGINSLGIRPIDTFVQKLKDLKINCLWILKNNYFKSVTLYFSNTVKIAPGDFGFYTKFWIITIS